jgi:hypothetical protein
LSNADIQKAQLMMTILALAEALSDALLLLSETLGRENTKWLDEFEAEAIKNLKNASIEGVSIEADAKITEAALLHLKFAIGEARARIIDGAKGG